MLEQQYHYETKFVAFVDILGFRNKTNAGDLMKQPVHKTLDMIHKFMDLENYLNKNNNEYYYRFSDSMLFSFDQKSFDQCIGLIAYLQFACATKGFFLRGGITYDKIFDRSSFFYGRGLNRAYELESAVACYPRVILDPSLSIKEEILTVHNEDYDADYNISLGELFKQDFDGCYYIDFLHKHEVKVLPDVNFKGISYLKGNYKEIENGISKELKGSINAKNSNLIIKYQWLSEYYKQFKDRSKHIQ